MGSGYIYLAETEHGHKIGKTVDPQRRFSQHRNAFGVFRVLDYQYVSDMESVESELVAELRPYTIDGYREVFHPAANTPAVYASIVGPGGGYRMAFRRCVRLAGGIVWAAFAVAKMFTGRRRKNPGLGELIGAVIFFTAVPAALVIGAGLVVAGAAVSVFGPMVAGIAKHIGKHIADELADERTARAARRAERDVAPRRPAFPPATPLTPAG